MRGQLDRLVPPFGGAVVAGDDAHAVQAPEVAVDEGVAALRVLRGALGQAQVPGGVLVPGVLLEERVLVRGARRGLAPVVDCRAGIDKRLDQPPPAAGADCGWCAALACSFACGSTGVRLTSTAPVMGVPPGPTSAFGGIVALNTKLDAATAAKALLGASFRVSVSRGKLQQLESGISVVATVHPSAVLRVPDDAREQARR